MAKNMNDVKNDVKTDKAKTPAVPSRCMYMGPNMSEKGVLFQKGRIFNNGIPLEWLEKIAAEPEFRQLLVAIDNVPKATADRKNPDSIISLAYSAVEKNYLQRLAVAAKEKK